MKKVDTDASPELAPIVNWVFFIIGTVNLGAGTWNLITGDASVAATGLTAGLLLLFASTIERFEILKGMGLEAKTRKLDDKIVEADRAFERLRILAEISGKSLIDLASKTGRVGTALTIKESYDLSRKIKQNLEELECSSNSVAEALKPWAKITAFDICSKLSQKLYKRLFEIEREIADERDRLAKPINVDDESFNSLTSRMQVVSRYNLKFRSLHEWELDEIPVRIKQLFDEAPELLQDERIALSAEMEDWLPDIRYLVENLDLKNKEKWFRELARTT